MKIIHYKGVRIIDGYLYQDLVIEENGLVVGYDTEIYRPDKGPLIEVDENYQTKDLQPNKEIDNE